MFRHVMTRKKNLEQISNDIEQELKQLDLNNEFNELKITD